jgi:hypothetical protein
MTLHFNGDRDLHRRQLVVNPSADLAACTRHRGTRKTHNVALLEEELGEVGTILAGDAGD